MWLPLHNETTEMPQNKTLGYLRDGEQASIVKFNISFRKVFQIWFLYQEIVLFIDDDMYWERAHSDLSKTHGLMPLGLSFTKL